jgi:hypothetical protein
MHIMHVLLCCGRDPFREWSIWSAAPRDRDVKRFSL